MNAPDHLCMLQGKVAVVTGANRGIGQVIAATLATHGAHVLACVRRPDELPPLADLPGHCTPIALDLSDEASVKAAVRAILAVSPTVDVLVNNAGVASGALAVMTPLAELRRLFEVNFFGPLLLAQSLGRVMARQKRGAIIQLSSSAAWRADPGTLAYGCSKAALERATLSLARELGPAQVRVNAIAPGLTHTDMYEQMDPAAREALLAATTLGRAAQAQDVANLALFLASDQSAHITGQVLRVDGGLQ